MFKIEIIPAENGFIIKQSTDQAWIEPAERLNLVADYQKGKVHIFKTVDDVLAFVKEGLSS